MKPVTQLNVSLQYFGGFSFDKPYELLKEILPNASDPLSSPYLQRAAQGYISFTNEACLIMTNMTRGMWTMYDNNEIWNRIVTWKLPLITLLFQLPRPPFPFRWWTNTNVFILIHLVGNPISTIASLLVTMRGCQQRVQGFQQAIDEICKELISSRRFKDAGQLRARRKTLSRRLALIQVSYDEWGAKNGYEFFRTTLVKLYFKNIPEAEFKAIMHHLDVAAESLAADRATFVLPIFIALFMFVISIGAAYWRVIGTEPHPGLWTNVEAYSIAMSAPFLYLLPAVFFGAVIGVPQTERSVQRVLNDLAMKLEKEGWPCALRGEKHRVKGSDDDDDNNNDDDDDDDDEASILRIKANSKDIFHRIFHGGMYSWRPDLLLPDRLSTTWPHILLSFLTVFFSVMIAGWISYQVPPEGFDCRNAGQASLLGVWVLSFVLDYLLTVFMVRLGYGGGKRGGGGWYEISFVKEVVMGSSVIILILMTQFGIFNRCDCFTLWGKVPLALPEIPEVAAVLMERIAFEWPAVTFGWIAIEMVFCAVVWWVYRDAFQVYNQEDELEIENEIDFKQ